MRTFEDLWEMIHKDSQDFGRGFARIQKGFVGLWERVCEDSQDFGRGFARLWERIRQDL